MLNCLQNIFRENHTTVITVQEYRSILKNRELRIQRLDIFFITLWMHTLQMFFVEILPNVPVFPLVTPKIFQVSIPGQNHSRIVFLVSVNRSDGQCTLGLSLCMPNPTAGSICHRNSNPFKRSRLTESTPQVE